MKPSAELYDRATTCCFTGHRCQKLPWRFKESDLRCIEMKESTKAKIVAAIEKGYNTFISGMAIGFDMICAEIVLELRQIYPIRLVCALPCKTQPDRWSSAYQERYHKILQQADSIHCDREIYSDTCMQERNEYMINHSSLVIALYNGLPGGTAKTLQYAKKQGLDIEVIDVIT